MGCDPLTPLLDYWRTLPEPLPPEQLEAVRQRLGELEDSCRQMPEFWAVRCLLLAATAVHLYNQAGGPAPGLAQAIARYRRARSRCQPLDGQTSDLAASLHRADERVRGV